ncbi:hypothetical protein [Halomonas campaniensis]|uniref:hypothetical protein n=1 Tax=Halomonas campaniensis TaxID=213554 RepID=UPI003561A97E
MAERPDDRRYARPIVPDPDSSLSAYRLRHPPPPRVWPLWLLILGLVAAGGALGWYGWQERNRLTADLARVSGELSNVHARFDTALGEGEALDEIEGRLASLERRDEALDGHLGVLEERLEEQNDDLDERLEGLRERLTRIGEAAATREAMLAATGASLDALERAGEEGRAALEERIAALAEARERDARRLAEFDEGLAELEADTGRGEALARLEQAQDSLEERLTEEARTREERVEALAARLAGVAAEVEAAGGSRDDEAQRLEALAGRLGALEAEIGELRRSQLALSARLEALRP